MTYGSMIKSKGVGVSEEQINDDDVRCQRCGAVMNYYDYVETETALSVAKRVFWFISGAVLILWFLYRTFVFGFAGAMMGLSLGGGIWTYVQLGLGIFGIYWSLHGINQRYRGWHCERCGNQFAIDE